ncbi:uncharacterized protein LOC143804235 [Ranitomeya variabilis]|uniref:uncharacterized protein LOC143804235 n=1 Tax=Ranitomeya variabilis TaxID=490064 RepID=UPI0040578867
MKMDFRAIDIFALIHPFGTSTFDISFGRPEGLELFWLNYELVKEEPGWRGFAVEAISRQRGPKKVTVLTCNESLSGVDIMTWLSRYGEVVEVPKKNQDDFGIWSGGWTFMVKLKRSGGTVTHIPSSAFLGRDRILVFYQGQPKVCHRCGDPRHFSAGWKVQKCSLCGEVGHLAASCGVIRCHLCGDLGHPFSRCPRSFSNAMAGRAEGSREEVPGCATSAEVGGGSGGGAEGLMRNGRARGPSYQRRQARRQEGRGQEEPRETGVMAAPSSKATAHVTEAPGEEVVNEEIRRMENEEVADLSDASQYESFDEDGGE